MPHRPDEDLQRVERIFTDVYRDAPVPMLGERVIPAVMRDIRHLGHEDRWKSSVGIDHLVWRTAAVAATVVLLLAMLTVGLMRPMTGESLLLAEEFESAPLLGDE